MEQWVLDVTFWEEGRPLIFCPVDPDGAVVVGLAYISDAPPGKLIGVYHADGNEAVETWCATHPAVLDTLPFGKEPAA